MRIPLATGASSILLLNAAIAFATVDNNPVIEYVSRPNKMWSIALENDALAGSDRDNDYSFGLTANYTASDAASLAWSPYRLQRYLDEALIPEGQLQTHSAGFGFYGFTPDNIRVPQPIYDDRPYASLIYVQSTRETVHLDRGESWTSSLTLGVLGMDVVGSLQNSFHGIADANKARGWDHQISEGGELTARYSLARQRVLLRNKARRQFKSTVQLSLGYLTEASYGLSFRAGDIHSSWWSFDPELISYGELSSPLSSRVAAPESFWWGGMMLKMRAYNAFLQGQFRDSEVTYQGRQLRPLMVEAWLGYTKAFEGGFRISYWLRGHSSEIREGRGDRGLVWGGIGISRSF